jgi:sulfate adenylyltransferase subunit 2
MPLTSDQSHLKNLEAESIYIIREAVAEFKNPVMLYSIGKDSGVMVRLAQKAFFPGPIPFPLMHVDTGFKFPEMYEFRKKFCEELGVRLIIERNEAWIAKGANPYDLGVDRCCANLKTQGLLQALQKHSFDVAFGGARREEEKSRAKERVFSFRDRFGQWDPKNQRPELWNLFNSFINEGESVRVFPLSNWTEVDIWQYIKYEGIPVVPLYFAQKRLMVKRKGMLIPVYPGLCLAADRARDAAGEEAQMILCRYRSLGCIPCSGAVASEAATIDAIIEEVSAAKKSERENRIIDLTGDASMEQKKKEGYF